MGQSGERRPRTLRPGAGARKRKPGVQCSHGCQTGRAPGLPDLALEVGTEVGKEEEEDNNSSQLPGQTPAPEKFLEG